MREFILAGRAKFTIRSDRTGKHYTFKVKKDRDSRVWYVSKLTTGSHYLYLGSIFGEEEFNFRMTKKSTPHADKMEAWKAFDWLWDYLKREEAPPQLTFLHMGKCGMCGIELSDPVSIKEGYGPDCRKKRTRVY